MAALLFQKSSGRSDESNAYGQLVGAIAHANKFDEWSEYLPGMRFIAQNVAKTEQSNVDRLWRIVKGIDPKAEDWSHVERRADHAAAIAAVIESEEGDRRAAEMLVRGTASQVGLELDDDSLSKATARAREVFPIQLRLYNTIAAAVVRDGVDMRRPENRNWIWDWLISFSTSPVAQISGTPLWLVTTDALILRAAERVDSTVVRSLAEYEALLQSDTDRFTATLAGASASASDVVTTS